MQTTFTDTPASNGGIDHWMGLALILILLLGFVGIFGVGLGLFQRSAPVSTMQSIEPVTDVSEFGFANEL